MLDLIYWNHSLKLLPYASNPKFIRIDQMNTFCPPWVTDKFLTNVRFNLNVVWHMSDLSAIMIIIGCVRFVAGMKVDYLILRYPDCTRLLLTVNLN